MRRYVACWVLVACSAHADEPCGLAARTLPPIAARPTAAAASAAKKLLASTVENLSASESQNTDVLLRESLGVLLRAIELDPANIDARQQLAALIRDNASDLAAGCEDEVRRQADLALLGQWLLATLQQLRDAGWYGRCGGACIEALDQFVLRLSAETRASLGIDPAVDLLAESLAHGPRGKTADATRAVLKLMLDDWNHGDGAANNSRFVDGGPIHIERHTYVGKKGLGQWMDRLKVGFPGPGAAMWCKGNCCRFPFIDNHPHKYQMTEMCFDSAQHLRSIRTEMSGM